MESSQSKTIYFITGSSGVGKTTLVDHLKKKHARKPWAFIHFDTIGVPSLPEMERMFGSPQAWQRAKTLEWIDRLVQEHDEEKIFLEGQVDLQFIREGFAKHNFKNYYIVLLDCNEEEMGHRLTYHRAQPELFTEAMKAWLQYLRKQAKASKTLVVASSGLLPEEVVTEFEKAVGL